jgi:DNA-binding transcriptional MerR regulator
MTNVAATATYSDAPVPDPATLDSRPAYSVAEASARTGLSAHTLRYYERVGLMPRVGRTGDGSHRRYSERDLAFIEFLKRLRATGMPIGQMERYVALVGQGDGTLEERRAMLTEHGERVRQQIAALRESLAVIEWKVEHYRQLGLGGAADATCESAPAADEIIVERKEAIK